MSIFRLIYVGNCALTPDVIGNSVDRVKDDAIRKIRVINITGCLIYCCGRFAGIIEGDQASIRSMMTDIRRDPRHIDASALREGIHDERIFPDWSLGYVGKSLFIAAIIERASHGIDHDIARLAHTIKAFAGDEQL